MLKSIFIARYLIIGLRIPNKHAHLATYLRGEFYIVIIRARIQALLRQRGGIYSEHKNLHRSLIFFVDSCPAGQLFLYLYPRAGTCIYFEKLLGSWPQDNLSVTFSESPFRLYLTGKQATCAISYHRLAI